MKISVSIGSTLITAALLVACDGSSRLTGVTPSRLSALPPNIALPPLVQPDRRRSWIAPDASTATQLLFVTDPGTFDVDIFALPSMALKGKLTGFSEPLGICSDTHGNVWIANFLKRELLEYSRAGAQINKIARRHLSPWGCAVSPTTGAIAITDLSRPRGRSGEVLVYSTPSAAPVILRNPVQFVYYYATYDSEGRLWVDGFDGGGHSIISKCGKASCSTLYLHGGSIFAAGAISWDNVGKTLVVFDQYCRDTPTFCSYPVSERGVVGTPTMYLSYSGSQLCYLYVPALTASGDRSFVVGADNGYQCGYASTVDRWLYPAGGAPMNYSATNLLFPWGAAVSRRPR